MIIQIYDDDLLNGDGIREVVFLQGCHHHCKNCFNKETWEFKEATQKTLADDIKFQKHLYKKLQQSYISGITITGGDPLAPENLWQTTQLAQITKATKDKTVWIYTGYTWENLQTKQYVEILSLADVLCEGPFIESLKSPNKPWVGSSNQRVIDVQKSIKENKIVLYEG